MNVETHPVWCAEIMILQCVVCSVYVKYVWGGTVDRIYELGT